MSRDPWRGLESAAGLDQLERKFNLQQMWIPKGEHENCFEFVNSCERVDEALPRTCCSTGRWW